MSIFKNKKNKEIYRDTKPISFVPHWFVMGAIIIAAILITMSILIPIFIRLGGKWNNSP